MLFLPALQKADCCLLPPLLDRFLQSPSKDLATAVSYVAKNPAPLGVYLFSNSQASIDYSQSLLPSSYLLPRRTERV
jgi:hypothetical protein